MPSFEHVQMAIFEKKWITFKNSLLQRCRVTLPPVALTLSTYSKQRFSVSGFKSSPQQLALAGVKSSDLTQRTSRVCRPIEQDKMILSMLLHQ